MSKMGQHVIRDAESRSLDNAEEVERLRAENERLLAENSRLLGQIDGLCTAPGRGRISYRGANGRWYDTQREAASQYTWSEGGREHP